MIADLLVARVGFGPRLIKLSALMVLAALLLSGCSQLAYEGSDPRPPALPSSLTDHIELSASGNVSMSATQRALAPSQVSELRNRVPLVRNQNAFTDVIVAPIQDMFQGREDPNSPPGTRGSAQMGWQDDGNGSPPSHWVQIGFGDLPGWQMDNHAEALASFMRSCQTIGRRGAGARMGKPSYSGYAGQWQNLCAQAQQASANPAMARPFFERNFTPFSIPGVGKFTGYYEASLNGSRTQQGQYQWPLYRRPSDLKDGQAYFDRAQIDAGVLAGQGLELLWIDNPVDIFLLHIQGSGVVNMNDGSTLRVGYAGNNGHSFKGILPALEAKGYDKSQLGLTIQAYRNWLLANPAHAREVMNYNPRFIFFDFNEAPAARGDGGTLLTAQRSMAVDKSIIPLHVPLWVTTNVPGPSGQGQVDVARLMIAQDTGTAIKGEIRGDYYWGPGPEAFERAGRMWGKGTYRVLLPNFSAQ